MTNSYQYSLEAQREIEVARGWKPSYSALTYCTAEAVLFRRPTRSRSIWDCEILDAERTSGAPDCLGKRQGKWGAYVYPKDQTARHAFQRGLREQFDWDVPLNRLHLAGIVGPWLHKATARMRVDSLILSVREEQAELTPFEAKLFVADVTGFELGEKGAYLKATRDARWITLRNLVAEQGENENYLYWQMIAVCVRYHAGYPRVRSTDDLLQYFPPGEYEFPARSWTYDMGV